MKKLEKAETAERKVNKYFAFVDFDKKVMKNSTLEITYLNEKKNEFVQSIVRIQKKLAATFLKEKKEFVFICGLTE